MELTKTDTLAIKGIAICLMLFHHQFLHASDYSLFAQSLASVAKVCVSLFLFVSGYGLARQYAPLPTGTPGRILRNTLRFILQRLTKFYFVYWFCFAAVLLVGILCGRGLHEAYPDRLNPLKCLLLDLLGLMEYNSYLPEWWFNKMILQLYLLFPLLYGLLRTRVGAVLTLLSAAALALWPPVPLFCIAEGGLLVFVCGMALAQHPIALPRRAKGWLALVAALLLLPLALLRLHYSHLLGTAVTDTLLTLCLVVGWLAIAPRCPHRALCWLGGLSAVMYLTHSLLLLLLPQLLYPSTLALPCYLIFLALSIAVAWLLTQIRRLTRYDLLTGGTLRLIDKLLP